MQKITSIKNDLELLNISFDLDNTLIPYGNSFDTEHRSLVARLIGIEKIRKDSYALIHHLQSKGHHIHIYTTSFRSKFKIRMTLLYYKIRVKRIINQKENQKILSKLGIRSSKYPPAFQFDLHVDDEIGVGIESEHFNFNTLIISPSDIKWTETIKDGLSSLQ